MTRETELQKQFRSYKKGALPDWAIDAANKSLGNQIRPFRIPWSEVTGDNTSITIKSEPHKLTNYSQNTVVTITTATGDIHREEKSLGDNEGLLPRRIRALLVPDTTIVNPGLRQFLAYENAGNGNQYTRKVVWHNDVTDDFKHAGHTLRGGLEIQSSRLGQLLHARVGLSKGSEFRPYIQDQDEEEQDYIYIRPNGVFTSVQGNESVEASIKNRFATVMGFALPTRNFDAFLETQRKAIVQGLFAHAVKPWPWQTW